MQGSVLGSCGVQSNLRSAKCFLQAPGWMTSLSATVTSQSLRGACGDRRWLAVHDDHPTRVLSPAVVLFVGDAEELLVPPAVARAERVEKAVPFAAFPELFLEDLALVRLREKQKEVLLVSQRFRLRTGRVRFVDILRAAQCA